MRPPFSEILVTAKPQAVALSEDGAFRFVCGALALSLALLIFRIVGQL